MSSQWGDGRHPCGGGSAVTAYAYPRANALRGFDVTPPPAVPAAPAPAPSHGAVRTCVDGLVAAACLLGLALRGAVRRVRSGS